MHVDVGPAALGQGLHNASSGKVPMITIAGEAPTTLSGIQGCRSEPVQWYQDVYGQGDLVKAYSRYTCSLAVHDDIGRVVSRAKLMATTGAPGPVYLTASRELLAAEVSRPANTVHKFMERVLSFPALNPAWISPRTGARSAIASADLILILDCDVPWILSKVCPAQTAIIWHLEFDARKDFMQRFGFDVDFTLHAECKFALKSICDKVETGDHQAAIQSKHQASAGGRQSSHAKGFETLHALALTKSDNTIHADLLFATLRDALERHDFRGGCCHEPEPITGAATTQCATHIFHQGWQRSWVGRWSIDWYEARSEITQNFDRSDAGRQCLRVR